MRVWSHWGASTWLQRPCWDHPWHCWASPAGPSGYRWPPRTAGARTEKQTHTGGWSDRAGESKSNNDTNTHVWITGTVWTRQLWPNTHTDAQRLKQWIRPAVGWSLREDNGGDSLTSFPPMASNIFSSWTLSCWMLLIRMQGWGQDSTCLARKVTVCYNSVSAFCWYVKTMNVTYKSRRWADLYWKVEELSSTTHHFLHCDIVGKQLGDDISIGEKNIADGLGRKMRGEKAIGHQVGVRCNRKYLFGINVFLCYNSPATCDFTPTLANRFM